MVPHITDAATAGAGVSHFRSPEVTYLSLALLRHVYWLGVHLANLTSMLTASLLACKLVNDKS